MTPGTRVAVVSADMKMFLGYGEYLGDFHHPHLVEEYALVAETHPEFTPEQRSEIAVKIRAHETFMGKNPKILLDDGSVAWGCETWWGPADAFIKNGYAEKYGVLPQEQRP